MERLVIFSLMFLLAFGALAVSGESNTGLLVSVSPDQNQNDLDEASVETDHSNNVNTDDVFQATDEWQEIR